MSAQSPTTSGVAERYASALFDLALESGAVEATEAELKSLSNAMNMSPELRTFLKSPVYGRDDKANAINAVADKSCFSQLLKNFLGLVAQNQRLFALDEMIGAFFQRAADHRGEVSAEAISAAPLNEDQTRRLRGEIEGVVGKAVNLETRVDPDLLGGLIVKVGSRMIDSSLKTKLNRMKTMMKEA